METSKEVTKKKTNEVATYQPAMDLLGQAPTLSADHLRLSKIKIHQGTTTGRAGQIGELFSTPDMAKVAGPGEKLTFYPITYKLSWYHNEKKPSEQKPRPKGVTPWKAANQFDWKKTDADGTIHQNFQTATFFGILESDLDKGVTPTPIQLVLSSTSFSAAALPLMNRYDEMKRQKIEPWLMKFTVTSQQSAKGAWQVFKIEPVADKNGHVRADEKHWATLRKWTSTIFTMQNSGKLDQTAEEMAQEVEETPQTNHSQPLNEEQLPY